jgi:hypothetical protein
MLWTKLTTTTIIVTKNLKPNNVPINVILVVMTHSQVPKQQAFRDSKPVKAKAIVDW